MLQPSAWPAFGPVFSDYPAQARKAGLRLHETPSAVCYWRRGRPRSVRTGGGGGIDLAQERAQVVALTVHYGWSYGQGGAIGALRTA